MNFFIPVLLVCLNGNCQFFQQLVVYVDEEECSQSATEMHNWYRLNTPAKVESACITVVPNVVESKKPKA